MRLNVWNASPVAPPASSAFHVRLTSAAGDEDAKDGAVRPDSIGYVTHVDRPALRRLAEREGARIRVRKMPGAFVTPNSRLATTKPAADDWDRNPAEAFTIGRQREFDQDPRFGLVVLSEIASRALSPAVNDPGTAIAVLGSGVRVLDAILRASREREQEEELIELPGLVLEDLLDDLFAPIARDGAKLIEVQIKIQRSLAEIASLAPEAAGPVRQRAARLLADAEARFDDPADRARLALAHGRDD